jgi:hypothetical protein
MKRKFRRNQKIKFRHIDEFTGQEVELEGIIIGFGREVRRFWPEEMTNAPNCMMLVFRQDQFANKYHHAIMPSEIVEDAKCIKTKHL